MAEKQKNFSSVGQILGHTMGELKLEDNIRVYSIWKNWKSLVGPYLAEKTHPDSLRAGTLTISVDNHMIIQELEFQKVKLLEQIHLSEKNIPLERIVFKLKKD